MNIEEAKQVIYNMEIDENSISCKNCVLENRKSCVVNGKDCQMEAIYTVLNELDKKDKVIDLMTEDIFDYEKDIKYYVPEYEEFFKNKEEVKEYYFNEIEIPEEN